MKFYLKLCFYFTILLFMCSTTARFTNANEDPENKSNLRGFVVPKKPPQDECFKGNCKNGYGEYRSFTSKLLRRGLSVRGYRMEIYKGSWSGGKRNGFGKLYKHNGDVYNAEWKNNKKHGYGELIKNNGDILLGEWDNDKKNGYFVKIYLDRNTISEYVMSQGKHERYYGFDSNLIKDNSYGYGDTRIRGSEIKDLRLFLISIMKNPKFDISYKSVYFPKILREADRYLNNKKNANSVNIIDRGNHIINKNKQNNIQQFRCSAPCTGRGSSTSRTGHVSYTIKAHSYREAVEYADSIGPEMCVKGGWNGFRFGVFENVSCD